MTTKRNWSGIVLALMLALVLCGCGVKEKSEAEIKADLSADLSVLNTRTDVALQNFAITKRQTDQDTKVDTVFADFSLLTNDGVAEGSGSCVMTYTLYNDGWMLDDVAMERIAYKPLKGADYSDDEIADGARSMFCGDASSSAVEVTGRTTDLENGIDQYLVTINNRYKYMKETLERGIEFQFDTQAGCWNMGPTFELDTKEKWNIEGRYEVEMGANKCGFVLKNGLVQGKEEGCFEYLRTPDSEYGEVHRIYKLSEYSSQVFWGSTVPSTFNMGRYYLGGVVDNHFKAIFDYNRFDYCVHFHTRGDRYLDLVFIGKDSIEFCDLDWDVKQDNYKRTVTITTTPMKRAG